MNTIPLRTSPPSPVDGLMREIAGLVALRQELRAGQAEAAALEHNRLEIARCQRELSGALIAQYLPQAKRAA